MSEDAIKIFTKAKIVNGKIENVNPIDFGWAIENLIQENKKLKEKNKELNNKILNFINNELPDDEICECCSNYDVNGVRLKNELKKLLEEGE